MGKMGGCCCGDSGVGGNIDHFAPAYLVGNVPAGDSAAAHNIGGFRYIPDIGDGVGIQTALAAAAAKPGDIEIRRGTYDFELGAITGSLAVPAGVWVHGQGPTTIIQTRATGSQGAFTLAAGASVTDMAITAPAHTGGVPADRGLVTTAGDLTTLARLLLTAAPNGGEGTPLRFCIVAQAGNTTRRTTIEDVTCSVNNTIGSTVDPAGALAALPANGSVILTVDNFNTTGGDISIFDPSVLGQGINQLIGQNLTLFNATFGGVRWAGVAQISTLNVTLNGPNAGAIMVSVASRPGVPATVLRDVYLDPKGTVLAGVIITADVNLSIGINALIDGVTTSGNGAFSAAYVSLAAAASQFPTIRRVFSAGATTIAATAIDDKGSNPDLTIEECGLAFNGTSGRVGISALSDRSKIRGNTIATLPSGAGGKATAILASGGQDIITGNNIVTLNALDVGIDLSGSSNGNVIGNILDMTTDANYCINIPVSANVAQNVIV